MGGPNRSRMSSEECCDIDGARLWIGPGGQIYCDLIHDPDTINAEQKRLISRQPSPFNKEPRVWFALNALLSDFWKKIYRRHRG